MAALAIIVLAVIGVLAACFMVGTFLDAAIERAAQRRIELRGRSGVRFPLRHGR